VKRWLQSQKNNDNSSAEKDSNKSSPRGGKQLNSDLCQLQRSLDDLSAKLSPQAARSDCPEDLSAEKRIQVAVAEAFARLLEDFGHNGEKTVREIAISNTEPPDLH